jgi:peptidoglycan/LPS O-acetylase OafA/YrhL
VTLFKALSDGDPLVKAGPDGSRAQNLDVIRLTLALCVLVSHAYLLSQSSAAFHKTDPLLRLTRGQMDLGGLSVNLFFVISGYLITQSWLKTRDARQFLRARILRIYPGFIAASLFGLLIVGPLATDSLAAYRHTLGVHNLVWLSVLAAPTIPGPPVVFEHQRFANFLNGSLWTLRYEFWCYLILLGYASSGMLKSRRTTLISWLAIMLVYRIMNHYHIAPLQGREVRLIGAPAVYPRFLTYFFAGIAVFQYKNVLRRSNRWAVLALVLLAVTCITGHGFEVWLAAAGSWLVFYLGFGNEWPISRKLHGNDLSYGIYLYGYPVEQLLIRYAGGIAPIPLLLLALAPTTIFALVSWHWVEKPALMRKKSRQV